MSEKKIHNALYRSSAPHNNCNKKSSTYLLEVTHQLGLYHIPFIYELAVFNTANFKLLAPYDKWLKLLIPLTSKFATLPRVQTCKHVNERLLAKHYLLGYGSKGREPYFCRMPARSEATYKRNLSTREIIIAERMSTRETDYKLDLMEYWRLDERQKWL